MPSAQRRWCLQAFGILVVEESQAGSGADTAQQGKRSAAWALLGLALRLGDRWPWPWTGMLLLLAND